MLAEIAVIPSAPLLVPELAGPGAVDTEPVRAAVLAAGRSLGEASSRWVAAGISDVRGEAPPICPRHGDFGAYGVPVPVELPYDGAQSAAATGLLPLSMLIAGWLGGEVSPRPVSIDPILFVPDMPPDECRAWGEEIESRIAACAGPVSLLVVADGANALSASAPGGGERDSATRLQRRIDAAVAAADPEGLAALTDDECRAEGVGTRAAWQFLAGILGRRPVRAEIRYAAAPFGVGYTVATLRPRETVR